MRTLILTTISGQTLENVVAGVEKITGEKPVVKSETTDFQWANKSVREVNPDRTIVIAEGQSASYLRCDLYDWSYGSMRKREEKAKRNLVAEISVNKNGMISIGTSGWGVGSSCQPTEEEIVSRLKTFLS